VTLETLADWHEAVHVTEILVPDWLSRLLVWRRPRVERLRFLTHLDVLWGLGIKSWRLAPLLMLGRTKPARFLGRQIIRLRAARIITPMKIHVQAFPIPGFRTICHTSCIFGIVLHRTLVTFAKVGIVITITI